MTEAERALGSIQVFGGGVCMQGLNQRVAWDGGDISWSLLSCTWCTRRHLPHSRNIPSMFNAIFAKEEAPPRRVSSTVLWPSRQVHWEVPYQWMKTFYVDFILRAHYLRSHIQALDKASYNPSQHEPHGPIYYIYHHSHDGTAPVRKLPYMMVAYYPLCVIVSNSMKKSRTLLNFLTLRL